MKISKHITYAEAIHSNTAKRKCIDNTPNPQQLENMKTTAEMVFEPLRGWVNGPIKVSSFFDSIINYIETLINSTYYLRNSIKDNYD